MNLNSEIAPFLLDELRQYMDVVEVVRCRDCEYWKHHSVVLDHDYCELTSTECKGNHFCSLGERRNDETDN